MDWNTRRGALFSGILVLIGLLGAGAAGAQLVGIRVTVADVRPALLEADLDLTAYTRTGGYSYVYAGVPELGIAALDFGHGTTLPTTTLDLTNPGGGPGGSSVFHSLASFTHTYPTTGTYTVRTSMPCYGCYRGSYVVFPPGNPASPVFSTVYDYVPTSVTGNLVATYAYSGTYPTPSSDYSLRYRFTAYSAITNTAQVVFRQAVQEIPSLSQWGLMLLGVMLAGGGVFVLRRF